MMKVWGRATSGNVQIVTWALGELGLDFDRVDVGGKFGGLTTPEFMAMNPNSLIPVVEDKGEIIWESAAILRYLGAAYGDNKFWPADPLTRALVDKWAEWMKTTFGPAFSSVFGPLIFTPSEKRDQQAIGNAVKRLQVLAPILDKRLGESAYLGGNDLCFADIVAGSPLYRYFTLEIERADTPNLKAYYDRLTNRPAYAQHVMISYEAMRAK